MDGSEAGFHSLILTDVNAIDRILYRGDAFELSAYSRAELKGSDHRPGEPSLLPRKALPDADGRLVFAIFRAVVRIVDPVKRAVLSRMLLDNVRSSAPGEKLDDKLATMVIPSDLFCGQSFSQHRHVGIDSAAHTSAASQLR